MNHWLFKSEPDVFGIDTLAALPGGRDHWDGIRNYQARNFMRDDMRPGDLGFFYHSSCPQPGIAGVIEVVSDAYPDHTAFDPDSPYHDPKSTDASPRWFMVDVQFRHRYRAVLSLARLREIDALADMPLLKKGNRLSIMPVAQAHWDLIDALARQLPDAD